MLFRKGQFISHSGPVLSWKVECDALDIEDLLWCADRIAEQTVFGKVCGVPSGGLKLAELLSHYRRVGSPFTLIVDDVLTTGRSMESKRQEFGSIQKEFIRGAVIFSRGRCPDWVRPIWQLEGER